MKLLITTFAAVMLSSQPLLVQAQTAPPAPAQPKPAVVATKVAGTHSAVIGSSAISGGEIGLYAAGALFVAVAAAGGGGSSHKGGGTDCHCGSGGGTTGTTGTH